MHERNKLLQLLLILLLLLLLIIIIIIIQFFIIYVPSQQLQGKLQTQTQKTKSMALVRKRTIPNERPPLVGGVNNNCGLRENRAD
jgi:hypothetical protein